MIDYVHQHFAKYKPNPVVAPVVCKDGTMLSVQASNAHYCTPRADTGPWTTVEVWCVERDGKELKPRSFGTYTSNPYGWVPVETVNKFIARHGGLAMTDTMEYDTEHPTEHDVLEAAADVLKRHEQLKSDLRASEDAVRMLCRQWGDTVKLWGVAPHHLTQACKARGLL